MVNKAIIIGRLGKDPEVRYTPDGSMITNFSIATDESYKDKMGEKIQRTEWHKVTAFGKLAEICGKYLTKGKLVYVSGKIRTQSWEKDGQKHYSTGIVADEMRMLDTKRDDAPQDDAVSDPVGGGDVPF